MRKIKPLLLAGLGVAALAGVAGVAAAGSAKVHTMTVQIPEGGVAHIRYVGDQPPKVVISEAATPVAFAPVAVLAGWDDPSAALDRVAAQMDLETNALLQQAAALEARALQADGRQLANLGQLAPGYTFVGNATGQGFCGRSVEVTYQGDGKAPRVVSHSWGDCAAASGDKAATPAPTAQPAAPNLVQARSGSARAETPRGAHI